MEKRVGTEERKLYVISFDGLTGAWGKGGWERKFWIQNLCSRCTRTNI